MNVRRIAITGANGFVGRHFVTRASARRVEVLGIVRSEKGAGAVRNAGGRPLLVSGLSAEALAPSLEGVDAVVHLAQIGAERGGATYREVNVAGTQAVIAAARKAGVGRFVYFSGLGVALYGQSRRCTNPYFLSKLEAEVALYGSGLEATVFRPSYIVGAGDSFVRLLAGDISRGEVELPGDGSYRLQPVAVADAADALLAAAHRPATFPLAFDLVGPEPITCAAFVDRVALALRAVGRPAEYRLTSLPVDVADRRAAEAGYRGMRSDELDCLLCDQVGAPGPLEALLGRFPTPLDQALETAARGLAQV
jgi:nucleoside-diphosphate-sugar epimerase